MKHLFHQAVRKTLHGIEMPFDAAKRHVKRSLNLYQPIRILPFRGFGNRKHQLILGRVLEDRPIGLANESDPWFKNAYSMVQRFRTDEIAFCGITGTMLDVSKAEETDSEGYFRVHFDADVDAGSQQFWHDVQLDVPDPITDQQHVTAVGKVLIPAEDAEFGVISDVDDTILKSSASNLFQLVKLTLMHNAHTRSPVPGAAEFYRLLHRGSAGNVGRNPIFYVSSSAWNLYDLFEQFMEVRGFPQGPILLRDLGIDGSKLLKSGHDHKLEKIREIMSYYPTLSFVLIGDSGQRDAWLYRDVTREFPGRVSAIYLHDVRASRRDDVQTIARELQSEGVEMHLIEDAHAAARHAAAEGLIQCPR